MTTSNRFPLPTFPAVPRRWPRWLVAIAAVLVLHFMAGLWVIRASGPAGSDRQHVEVPVQIALLKPQAVRSIANEQPPAGTSKNTPGAGIQPERKDALQASLGEAPHRSAQTARESVPPRRTRKPSTQVTKRAGPPESVASAPFSAEPAVAVSSPASPTPSASSSPIAASASEASAASGASATSASSANSNASSTAGNGTPGVAAAAANAPKGEKFSLPPSADLHYDSFYNGVQNPSGTIHWATDGSTYQMIVSIPLPFVGTYSYISEGRVDAYGLAPLRYTEQHGRRGTDVTTFTRDDGVQHPHALFSRNPSSVELPAGAQDRFSMFMQLSSLVRGDPARYTAGVTREFFVLDNDSGETWPIETVGDENVQTSQGFVPARHFTRLPRRSGDRRKVDVWLAPSLGWLPIRFMQTEPNGTEIELRYASSSPLQATARANDAASSPAANPSESPTGTPRAEPREETGERNGPLDSQHVNP
jgi:hypothetical protein